VGISIVIAITDSPFRISDSFQNFEASPQHDMPSHGCGPPAPRFQLSLGKRGA
jgi:hypothetical protein